MEFMDFQDMLSALPLSVRDYAPVVPSLGNASAKDQLNFSQLCSVVSENKTRDVEFLLRAGHDVDEKMENGRTVIFLAVKLGLTDMVTLLIHYGAQVNTRDTSGFTPLHLACFFRHKDIVRLLLSKNADINADSNIGTPILAATYLTHPTQVTDAYDVVSLLIEHGANVNYKSYAGITALHFAVEENNLRVVNLLIAAKADVNVTASFVGRGTVPLFHIAISKENVDIVKSFLAVERLNLKMREMDQKSPLHVACAVGNLPIVKLLVEKNFDVNAVTMKIQTPLLLALEYQHLHVAEYLLEQDRTNVDTPPHLYCKSPFEIALEVGASLPSTETKLKEKVMKAIIDKTKDVNKKTEWPNTPLALAVSKRDLFTVEYLIHSKCK